MSNSKRKQANGSEKPPSRFNFVAVLIAGIALAAVIAFGIRQQRSQQPTTPATPDPPQVTAAEPATQLHVPDFPASEVAAAERIPVVEAKRLIDMGEAVVIDVRNVEDYKSGHIPGSLQIPLAYVQGEIPWFPLDKKLVTYCT